MTLEFENQINIQPESEGGGGGGGSDAIGIKREVNEGVFEVPQTVTSWALPKGTKDCDKYTLFYAFRQSPSISSVDLSGLETITGDFAVYGAFYNGAIQTIEFPDLISVTGNYGLGAVCCGCTSLTSVSFPKLETVGERSLATAFADCTNLTDISFPELTTISDEWGLNGAFRNCAKLTTVTFPKLTALSKNAMYSCFEACTSITDVYFPALTTTSFPSGVAYGNTPLKIFNNVSGMNGKIHLPSNLSSVTWIQKSTTSSSSREQYFGSIYCTVLLDLPATS